MRFLSLFNLTKIAFLSHHMQAKLLSSLLQHSTIDTLPHLKFYLRHTSSFTPGHNWHNQDLNEMQSRIWLCACKEIFPWIYLAPSVFPCARLMIQSFARWSGYFPILVGPIMTVQVAAKSKINLCSSASNWRPNSLNCVKPCSVCTCIILSDLFRCKSLFQFNVDVIVGSMNCLWFFSVLYFYW